MKDVLTIIDNDKFSLEAVNDANLIASNSKYEKIENSNLLSHVSALTQNIPAIAESKSLCNAYRLVVADGLSGYLELRNDGLGYVPMAKDYFTNRYVSTSAIPLQEVGAIGAALTGLSMATSQVYLQQINNKLKDIQSKLDGVLNFLYTEKFCELYGESQIIYDIYKNFNSIIKNDNQCSASIRSILHAKSIAEKDIQFYYRDMITIINKGGRYEKIALGIRDALSGYNQALSLFGICCVLEPLLSQNFNKEYLNYIYDDLNKHGKIHDSTMGQIKGQIDQMMANVGILHKIPTELKDVVDKIESMLGEDSPLIEFEEVVDTMAIEYNSKTEYRILNDGTVYRKKIS